MTQLDLFEEAKAHYDMLISRHNGWLDAVRTLDILGDL